MKMGSNRSSAARFAIALACAALFLGPASGDVRAEKKPAREEGEFRIYASGKEIGSEKFMILSSDDVASSTSVLDFRNPGDRHQKVQLETKLEMDAHYVPKSYLLKSDVDGMKGTINGQFSPNQAIFEYLGSGTVRKGGLLVGTQYTLLDTNIFHQFIFLARLFIYGSKDKVQSFEVVIPQEQDNGMVKISELNRETISVRGKKIETHHLQVDSGSVVIHLWVDGQKILHKITVPSRQIEVVRNP